MGRRASVLHHDRRRPDPGDAASHHDLHAGKRGCSHVKTSGYRQNPGSIQTFGEMDVLCTDKTGTLTEDRIILENYMNVVGDDDNRTLRHAFLNSYFQTGLKNLLDLAIINRAHENGIEAILNSYTRLDDIPFDFSRRRMSVLLEDRNGKILKLDETLLQKVRAVYEQHNRDGLRMIAVAQKNDVTGDSEGVAVKVCSKVGVETSRYLTGKEVEAMDDSALSESVERCSIFAKLSPSQKERVVKALQTNGHTVGYMGDGINDAPPLHQADVGISVDTAVDIAKETADIILLKKDLMVLEKGVVAGRRTFGNIVKYIKMAASGNFGNMISVIAASLFLPCLLGSCHGWCSFLQDTVSPLRLLRESIFGGLGSGCKLKDISLYR